VNKKILLLIIIVYPILAYSQKKNAKFQYKIKKTDSVIKIDGILDEKGWNDAQLATDFYMVLPMDTSYAKVKTDCRMTYDDNYLYVSYVNYNKLKGPNMVESLKPDFNFGKNDNDLLFLDTFDDQTNGFSFGANAAGARWDGVMSEGSSVNLNWENKWKTIVKADDEKWIWECAIPFKTLRYKKDLLKWGVNFSRLDLKTTEKSAWAPVPRQFPTASLAYTADLIWDASPPPAGKNISIIPFVLGGFSKYIEKNLPATFKREIGFDAKIAVSTALNLDLTVNPDFSQVEVDRQVTNLDRFELLFPERRQFFLENGDLFTSFGYQTIRPFFSRRIGLNSPIKFGARLSGKLNKDWRIGAMNMQTALNDDKLPAQNYSAFALQRKVFARSYVGAMFVNRQTTGEVLSDSKKIGDYNRNLVVEYNLASANNVWTGKTFFMKSFTPSLEKNNGIFGANILHNAKRWNYGLRYEFVSGTYNIQPESEIGYVPRSNYQSINPTIGHLFFPKSKKILSHGPLLVNNYFFDKSMTQIENEQILIYRINFRSTAGFFPWIGNVNINLQQDFDPTNFTGFKIKKNTKHSWNAAGFDFISKPQALFTYTLSGRYGGFYADGTRLNLRTELGYRFQPFVAIILSANYNNLQFGVDERLPQNLKNTNYNFWLIGPRIDVTLTNNLYFANFIQYNNQSKNINLNTRLQWRYSPASDIFLVYTDNYLPENFKVKNRALVFKLNYWLSL
jgi:hypothetical protein